MNNLTDKEIKKALECCSNHDVSKGELCETECPYKNNCYDKGKGIDFLRDTLDYINRLEADKEKWQGGYMTQKQEIANLEVELKAMRGAANSYKAENERLEKEVAKEFTCFVGDPHKVEHCPYLEELEKVRAENERLKETIDSFIEIVKLYSEIKAEAYKEFAERLKEYGYGRYVSISYKNLDNLLKEMVGDKE